jgi:hypothetical protein
MRNAAFGRNYLLLERMPTIVKYDVNGSDLLEQFRPKGLVGLTCYANIESMVLPFQSKWI